jgi:hypothetical protein
LLNISAVGASLAAIVVVVLGSVFGRPHHFGSLAWACGCPTLAVGVLWVRLLWAKGGATRSAWLSSIPLAAFNGALAAGLLFGIDERVSLGRFAAGLALGGTVGFVIWGPALVAVLIFFGIPIAWAQKLAKRGLAGEERGELVIGLASLTIALVALGIAHAQQPLPEYETGLELSGAYLTYAFALFGAGTGLSAAGLAWDREKRRRAFVASVEAGKVRGFCVEATTEGKMLLRVSSDGPVYRVARFDEPLFELDDEGRATRAVDERR